MCNLQQQNMSARNHNIFWKIISPMFEDAFLRHMLQLTGHEGMILWQWDHFFILILTSVQWSTSLMIWWNDFVKLLEVLAINIQLMIYFPLCRSLGRREVVWNVVLMILSRPWSCPPHVEQEVWWEKMPKPKQSFWICWIEVNYNSLSSCLFQEPATV